MRVIHIIPSAFNYFDAIRAEAFQLVENLDAIGVENDVFTLQYGAQSKTKQEQTEIVGTLASYDVVHAHAPLFGGAGKIIEWKKANPGVPFLVSYYQPVGASDLFGFLVRWYTIYYLPRLFKAADIVTCDSIDELYRKFGRGVVFNPEKLIEADEETKDFFGTDLTYDPNGLELTNRERLAVKYTMLYNELTN